MIARANSFVLSSFSVVLILLIATCQSQPRFEHPSVHVRNNSYIYYEKINVEVSLKCMTNMSINCCHDTNVNNWRDERGELFQEGADDRTCLYVLYSLAFLPFSLNLLSYTEICDVSSMT